MFFNYSKRDLVRRMKNAQSASSSIKLNDVYCYTNQGLNDTLSVTFSCECSDASLTGFGGDELYKIHRHEKLINQTVAFGYITERVYEASKEFKDTIFFYIDKRDGKPYVFHYPNKDWKIHPCHLCKNGSHYDPYDLVYGGPIPAKDCADNCIKQR
jgi:hypothetical protein